MATVVACAVLIAIAVQAPTTAQAKQPRTAPLVVKMSGLPKGAAGAVTVRGPHHFRAFLKRSARLRVPPGTYKLFIQPVVLTRRYKQVPAGSRAFPARRKVRVRVRAKRGGSGKARYGTIRSGSLLVLRKFPRKVIGARRSPEAIVLPRSDLRRVHRGSILAAAPSAQLPAGLFHRVKKLRNGRATLEAASLWDAFPSLDIDAKAPLRRRAPSGAKAGASDALEDVDLTVSTPLTSKISAGCGGPPQGWSFKPSGSLNAWVHSDIHREYLAFPYGKMTLTVQGSVGFSTVFPIGAHCDVSVGVATLQGFIPVFGVPVPVVGQADLNVSIEADAPVTANASASVTATTGVKLEGRRSAPILEVQRTGSGNVTATAGSVSIGPEIKAGVGAEGINAHLSMEPRLTGRATRTSCQIDLGLSAGVGLDVLILHPSYKPISPSTTIYNCPLPDGVFFEGGPGSGPPPSTLGPYTMTPFGSDPQATGWVDGVNDPAGILHFPTPLSHEHVGDGWLTWSHGYTGDVYMSENDVASVDLPAGTRAFYFYAEPDLFQDFNVVATTSDGISSGPVSVFGEAGARYFGFYTTGAKTLSSISVSAEDQLAIGEFGIAR